MEINIRKYNEKTNQWENIYEKEIEDDRLAIDEFIKYMKESDDTETPPTENASTKYKKEEQIKNVVNHPNHYKGDGEIECIDAIQSAVCQLKGLEAFCTGNAIKYLWRWKQKNGTEDLEKAEWYIHKLKEILR